jgi:hypothetical protein
MCLLLLYKKLAFGLKQHLAVEAVGCYVIVSLVLMEVLYLGVWCRPFRQYWAVPAQNEQCSTALHHLITNVVFNLTSDAMMFFIPSPLLITTQLPRTKSVTSYARLCHQNEYGKLSAPGNWCFVYYLDWVASWYGLLHI